MLCNRNGTRANSCYSGILLIRDKILGFNERSDYMNHVEAVKFFKNQEKVVKDSFPQVMGATQAAKQLEQNGLLRMDDYLGIELDNSYITTAFVLSNRKSKEES